MEDEFINCRLAAKITLVQCERRQIKMRRFDTSGTVDAHFISCRTCEHWLTDEQYVEGRKALIHLIHGFGQVSPRLISGKGRIRKMSQESTVAEHRLQPVVQQKRKFDEQEVAILRASYGKSLDPMEFKVYVATASHLNLDPFSREIYALKYGSHPMTLITSIGGYRKMTARSGRYLGLTEGTMLCRTEQGRTVTVKHSEYDPDTHTEIISGTIGIRVVGYPEPIMATAVFKSCAKKVQGRLTENWLTMPDVMILKCAEAAAHRRAALFPDGAAAVYVEGEVPEYSVTPEAIEPPKPIFPALEAPKPEPAKRTRATKATPRQEEPPAEPVTPEDNNNPWDETPVGKKYREIERFYCQQMGDPEMGWNYATALILQHFGVEDVTQITDVEALRKFGSGELLKTLQQESFLPQTRAKQ